MASAQSAQEWLDIIDRAKQMAKFHGHGTHQGSNNTNNDTYIGEEDDGFNISTSALSSQDSNTFGDQATDLPTNTHAQQRGTLHKQHEGHKRFSKRQSKSGLTAVF